MDGSKFVLKVFIFVNKWLKNNYTFRFETLNPGDKWIKNLCTFLIEALMMFTNISVFIFNIHEKKGLKIYAFRINAEFQEKEKSVVGPL